MIRVILFRATSSDEWVEGVPHSFQGDNAVIETLTTGELQLVPVTPQTLKFKILTKEWVEMQMKAQRDAMAAQGGGPAIHRFDRR